MKLKILIISILLSVAFSTDSTILVKINGVIDMGLPYYVESSIEIAEQNDSKVIIFEINTKGGRVDAATQIKDAILNTKIPTVAFINREAISAGALISLACDSIFMTTGATIGAATAVDLEGNKATEKVISYMREMMASTAEANGRNRNVAMGMVDEGLEISDVITSSDTITVVDVEGFRSGKLITLSTSTAIKLNIANKQIETYTELLAYLNVKEESVQDIKPTWSILLVRFLTNPTVAPLLMSLGFLGLLFEVKSPGFGFPGAIGLILLSLFFGSHFLVGLADFIEIIILIGGFVLVLIEIFVIPGFGLIGIMGGILIIWSLFGIMVGEYPTTEEVRQVYYGLTVGVIASIFAGIVLFKSLTKSKYYAKIIPNTSQKREDGYSISKGYEKLIGLEGFAQTNLRPSGNIEIKGQRYQGITKGEFIEKDSKIIAIGTDENQVVVKKT
jgi:membrane-bound serine protease (ClpP class)